MISFLFFNSLLTVREGIFPEVSALTAFNYRPIKGIFMVLSKYTSFLSRSSSEKLAVCTDCLNLGSLIQLYDAFALVLKLIGLILVVLYWDLGVDSFIDIFICMTSGCISPLEAFVTYFNFSNRSSFKRTEGCLANFCKLYSLYGLDI